MPPSGTHFATFVKMNQKSTTPDVTSKRKTFVQDGAVGNVMRIIGWRSYCLCAFILMSIAFWIAVDGYRNHEEQCLAIERLASHASLYYESKTSKMFSRVLGHSIVAYFPLPSSVVEAHVTSSASASDEELIAMICLLPRLRRIVLIGMKIGEVEIEKLSRLHDLKSLYLQDTMFTRGALNDLAKLKEVNAVTLIGPCYSDVELEHMRSIENLESVSIAHTNISRSGFKRFVEMKPECSIAHIAMPWYDWQEIMRGTQTLQDGEPTGQNIKEFYLPSR